MLATGLRSGYGLMQTLTAVASESAEPTRDELTRVINENRVGRPLSEALGDASLRMSNEDFYWVTEAIAINREVGGNLADVLDGIGHTIRERAQLRRQVRALSAEGRLSAYVLIGLPFAIAGMLVLVNPEYVGRFLIHPVGWIMLAASAVLLLLGGVWIRRAIIIKF